MTKTNENKLRKSLKKREVILKVLENENLIRLIYIFSGEYNILQINQHILFEIKKSVLLLNLNQPQSFKYINDSCFRSKVKNLVKNTKQQLSLNCRTIRKIMVNGSKVRIEDLDKLDELYFLNMPNNHEIKIANPLSGCYSLNLSCCSRLNDVSMLNKLYSLDLSWCRNITDVSTLSRVHKLVLRGCSGINDFSKLVCVHYLDLSNTNIKDTRGLENVHTLILIDCPEIRFITSLHKNKNLILEGNSQISDISALKNVERLHLSCLPNLVDVSQLYNVSFLKIELCCSILEVNGLESVPNLYLLKLRNLRSITINNSNQNILAVCLCPLFKKNSFKPLYTIKNVFSSNYFLGHAFKGLEGSKRCCVKEIEKCFTINYKSTHNNINKEAYYIVKSNNRGY